jgi:hypothetical protein
MLTRATPALSWAADAGAIAIRQQVASTANAILALVGYSLMSKLTPYVEDRHIPLPEHPTSNIEHPRIPAPASSGCSMLDVGCWLLDVLEHPAASLW